MPSPDQSESPPEAPRPVRPLYIRMYFEPAYIDLVRFIGYGGRPLKEVQPFVRDLAKIHGDAKVKEAGDAVAAIEGRSDPATVRLKDDVRKLAFQLLGPPPESATAPSAAAPPATSLPAPTPPPVESKKKPRKKPAKPAPAPTKRPATNKASPIMQQYRAAKEKHPDMLLVFRNVAK